MAQGACKSASTKESLHATLLDPRSRRASLRSSFAPRESYATGPVPGPCGYAVRESAEMLRQHCPHCTRPQVACSTDSTVVTSTLPAGKPLKGPSGVARLVGGQRHVTDLLVKIRSLKARHISRNREMLLKGTAMARRRTLACKGTLSVCWRLQHPETSSGCLRYQQTLAYRARRQGDVPTPGLLPEPCRRDISSSPLSHRSVSDGDSRTPASWRPYATNRYWLSRT